MTDSEHKKSQDQDLDHEIKEYRTTLKWMYTLLEIYQLTSAYENTDSHIELALDLVAGIFYADYAFILKKGPDAFQFSHVSQPQKRQTIIDLKKANALELFSNSKYLRENIIFPKDKERIFSLEHCSENDAFLKKMRIDNFSFCSITTVKDVNYILGVVNRRKDPQQLKYYTPAFADAIIRTLQERDIQNMAIRDQLTGLYNRTYYEAIASTYAEKKPPMTGLICADLYRLKKVNDTFGHLSGDDYIRGAANILINIFQDKGNYIFRTGGDEFVVITYGKTEEYIQMKIEKAKQYLKIHPIYTSKENIKIDAHINFGYAFARDYYEFQTEYQKMKREEVAANALKEMTSIDQIDYYDNPNAILENFKDKQLTLEDLFNLADARMNDDKAQYYRDNNVDRRK